MIRYTVKYFYFRQFASKGITCSCVHVLVTYILVLRLISTDQDNRSGNTYTYLGLPRYGNASIIYKRE